MLVNMGDCRTLTFSAVSLSLSCTCDDLSNSGSINQISFIAPVPINSNSRQCVASK